MNNVREMSLFHSMFTLKTEELGSLGSDETNRSKNTLLSISLSLTILSRVE